MYLQFLATKEKNTVKRVINTIKTASCIFALTLLLCSALTWNTALAQSAPVVPAEIPDSCDPDYMDVLNARSYLEGKREYEQAQRIILKPDSVLEYSCLHIDIDVLGNWGATFSENGIVRAGNPPQFDGGINIFGGNLDNALSLVVYESLQGFVDSFDHIYGGGTFTLIPSAGSGCNPMNIVWFASKCANFDPNWWVDYNNLALADVRTLPEPCAFLGLDTDRSTNISAALAAAYPVPATPAASGGMDLLDAFITETTGACSGPGNTPVPTGVTVTLNDGTNVSGAVCVIPKCHYNGSACVP